MKISLSNPKSQWLVFLLLVLGSGLYCLSDGDCSILTADQRGYRLFEQADYAQSSKRFVDPMWRGTALFRDGEFEQAASLFAGYDSAEAAFNHGNALVMQGQYESAIVRYSRALELRPDWNDAIVNLEIAEARSAALKKEGADMTGGKMGADDIAFDDDNSPPSAGEEQVQGEQAVSDAELRSIWLRQVQTRPADFLRAKFAYQYATRERQEP